MREMCWYDRGEPELEKPRENRQPKKTKDMREMFWYDGLALPKVVVWRCVFWFLLSLFATLPHA